MRRTLTNVFQVLYRVLVRSVLFGAMLPSSANAQRYYPELRDFLIDEKVNDIDGFCNALSRRCQVKFNSPTCAGGVSRVEYVQPADRIRKLEADFPKMKDLAQRRCCVSGDTFCERTLSETSLKITPSRVTERAASYHFGSKTIEIRRGLFEKWPSHYHIERVVFHELGHACQKARSGYGGACTDDTYEAVFSAVLGKNVFDCVAEKVEANPVISGAFGFCKNVRYSEAFADVFSAQLSGNPWAWTYDCFNYPDSSHPTNRSYMHCMRPFSDFGLAPSQAWQSIRPPTQNNRVDSRLDR